MRGLILLGTIVFLPLAANAAASVGQPATAQDTASQDEATRRLNEETNARVTRQAEEARQIEARNAATRERIRLENERAQREYQAQMAERDRAIAAERARYDAEMARYRAEVEANERRSARRGGGGDRRAAREAGPGNDRDRRTEVATGSCEEQQQRARRRGRTVGGVLGGVAGVVGGRNLGNAARLGVGLASVPIGALIGEAIASRLDCSEQQQAAVATEQAVEQAVDAGVGRSVSWRSETRENVSGTSTVTAMIPPSTPNAEACVTVTDVVIVDGEETRAEKRMCRRPPSTRFVRV